MASSLEQDWADILPPRGLSSWVSDLGARHHYPISVIVGEVDDRMEVYSTIKVETKRYTLGPAFHARFVKATSGDQCLDAFRDAFLDWSPWVNLATVTDFTLEGELRNEIDQGQFLGLDLFQAIWEIRASSNRSRAIRALECWLTQDIFHMEAAVGLGDLRICGGVLTVEDQIDGFLACLAMSRQNGYLGTPVIILDDLDPSLIKGLHVILRRVEHWANLDCPLGVVLGIDPDDFEAVRKVPGMSRIINRGLHT